jgi:RNA polymerase sigma-70 factor (ECF subfamily)
MARKPGRGETSQIDAFITALYNAHGHALLAHAVKKTGDRGLAEDVVQETFLQAWRSPDVILNGKGYVRAWLFKVARNKIIDRHRARQARPQEVAEDPQRPPVEQDHARRVVDSIALHDALSKLSPQHRQVLQEVYIRERSMREASLVLGLPQRTVAYRSSRALAALYSVFTDARGSSEECSA